MPKYKVVLTPYAVEYEVVAKDDDDAITAILEDFKKADKNKLIKVASWKLSLLEEEQ